MATSTAWIPSHRPWSSPWTPVVPAELDAICRGLGGDADLAVLAAEAVAAAGRDRLARALAGQPGWSGLPVLLLTLGSGPAAQFFARADNFALLHRPLRADALESAARAVLRAAPRRSGAAPPKIAPSCPGRWGAPPACEPFAQSWYHF